MCVFGVRQLPVDQFDCLARHHRACITATHGDLRLICRQDACAYEEAGQGCRRRIAPVHGCINTAGAHPTMHVQQVRNTQRYKHTRTVALKKQDGCF